MSQLTIYALLFALLTALSIALTGDRQMLSGDLRSVGGLVALVFHWKFITAMGLALASRVLFVLINSTTLTIPAVAQSATTVAAFATALSYPAIMLVNWWLLHEHLSLRHYAGAGLIVLGIMLSFTQGAQD